MFRQMNIDAFEEIVCAQCGFKKKRRKVRTRKRAHSFCTKKCASKFYSGQNSALWRGGSDPNRGREWIKLAEEVRQAFGCKCGWCGKTQEENGQKLSVDHVIPWRWFENKTEANDKQNLIPLCRSCHGKKTSGPEAKLMKGDYLSFKKYRDMARELIETGDICGYFSELQNESEK